MRPRAGHGCTWDNKGRKLIFTVDGDMIPTGKACGWFRCERCRKPEERPLRTSLGKTVCVHCYYLHCLPEGDSFWNHKDDYLFPYNIGDRIMKTVRARVEAA